MKYLFILLFVSACDIVNCDYQYVYNEGETPKTEQELFLVCLDKAKSSVTHANDDEDTDDTIYACRSSALYLTQERKKVCEE